MAAPQQMTREREWKSVPDAAAYAGVSKKTIRRRILDGSLPAHRLGPRLLRIDARDLDALFTPVPVTGGEAVNPAARATRVHVGGGDAT